MIKNQIFSNKTTISNIPQYRPYILRFEQFKGNKAITSELITEFFKKISAFYSSSSLSLAKTSVKQYVLQIDARSNDIRFLSMIDYLFKNIKIPKRNLVVSDSKVLSKEELSELTNLVGERWKLVIEALYISGARISELLNIRLVDCKRVGKAVEIHIIGKGMKEGQLVISSSLFDRINKHFQGKVFLFENEKTGRPLSRQAAHKYLQIAGKKIGRNVFPHIFRHTRATHLLKEMKSIDSVSKFLRHHSPIITARFYAHNKLSIDEIIDSGRIN